MDTEELRPNTFDHFIGQHRLVEALLTHCQSAKERAKPLEHILLAAAAGSGKTSLAAIIARETGDPFHSVIMPIKSRVLQNLVRTFHGILFMDEIHRMSNREQETLLPLLEDGYIQLDTGRRLQNGWLTIIGATTEPQKLLPALTDRFPIKPFFEDYTPDALTVIATQMAVQLQLTLPEPVLAGIGRAAGGIPRNVKSLVFAARDLTVTSGCTPTLEDVLHFGGVTEIGLTREHQQYMEVLNETCDGHAGLSTLSSLLRLHPTRIQELERLLLAQRLITITGQGREVTFQGSEKQDR